tara:strand:- start:97 stop:357 length:261 start_codon:yes stop_codon:yes gene_type:complete
MSSKRKVKRQQEKKAEKEIKEALGLFGKIPDKCLTCETEFDKTSKKMVSEWQVVVQKAKETVRLYCPTCWDTAVKIVKEYHEENVK